MHERKMEMGATLHELKTNIMEETLQGLTTDIEIITYLAHKTLDQLAEMQAFIDEALEKEKLIMSQG